MKKLMLSAAALMVGAVGFSQVTDNSPGGSGNTADQAAVLTRLAPAPASANVAENYQMGTLHKARIEQVGTRQSAYNEQNDGIGTGRNQADILQTGNVGPLSGEDNLAYSRQQGTRNESTTTQYGDDNNAHTDQGGDAAILADRNKALIRQGAVGTQGAEGNNAAVDQDGDRNQARTVQTSDNNDAWTIQSGMRNDADIRQVAAPNNTAGHRALVTQIGDLNTAHVNQSSDLGVRNSAETHQLGDRNKAWQVQSNDVGAPAGAGNDALINQGDVARMTGSNLTSSIGASLAAVDNTMGGGVNGDGSERGVAIQMQDGSRNEAESHQFGDIASGSNYSEQNQLNGERNDAYVVQNAYGAATGGNMYARQDQDGDDNEAGISQRGTNHKSAQFQQGNVNDAFSTQRGQNHEVTTNQWGDRNVVNTAQRGIANKALVNQNDGQSALSEQDVPGGVPDGGNQVHIYQAGPGGGMNPGVNFQPELGTPTFTTINPLSLPGI